MRKTDHHPALDVRGKRVVLLQGGGALGAYQVGAFEALQAHLERAGKQRIDWVAGISIGAINAAVIAGNAPGDLLPSYKPEQLRKAGGGNVGAQAPLSRLERLWKNISWPVNATKPVASESYGRLRAWEERRKLLARYAGFDLAATFGQPNFFDARLWSAWTNPWIAQWWRGGLAPGELAAYGTEPMRRTLSDPTLVDWELVNAPAEQRTRLSLGATNVTDAEMTFFDSNAMPLGPDHVLASGALPPAFPPVCIDGAYYLDGGVCSNTPLLDLQHALTSEATIVFDVHVWDRQGEVPRTMDELAWRQKCIQFGSRKRIAELIVDAYQHRAPAADKPPFVVCQVMYEYEAGASGDPGDASFAFSDADFSPESFELRRELGRKDMHNAFLAPGLVEGIGGDRAALYRYGTHGKHIATDRKRTLQFAGASVAFSAEQPVRRPVEAPARG